MSSTFASLNKKISLVALCMIKFQDRELKQRTRGVEIV